MKFISAIAAAGMLAAALPAAGQAPEMQVAPAEHYSVDTTLVGKLLDDPAAAAVLQRMIPTVYANEMFQNMGRDQTLKAIQQYEPTALSDAVLAAIQAELDKLSSGE